MKKIVFLLSLSGFLTSCTPSLTRDQELAIYRSRCLDYGYLMGTREFADCMMQQETKEQEFALQSRKIAALESQNSIEKDKVRVKENELRQKRKKKEE